jgi:hypothetical protein
VIVEDERIQVALPPIHRTQAKLRDRHPILLLLALSAGMTFVFWHELWMGASLVGGDTYTSFLPQKKYFADCIRAGELPLWNNLGGHGYPIIGESETGFCYPTAWPLYRHLPVNTAFNVNLILHFGLCFAFTGLYAHRLGLSPGAAALAALIYTYGWFPARVHWEWAYQSGAWLPLIFWCCESYLQSARRRFWLLFIFAYAVQLLSGHFTIAFYTLCALATYLPLRLYFGGSLAPEIANAKRFNAVLLASGIMIAFALAAIQVLPTWELKGRSLRREYPFSEVEYGRLPAPYLGQLIAPWYFYREDVDVNQWIPAGEPLTHKVEAHLYCGLIPLALALCALCSGRFLRVDGVWPWVVIGALGLLFATGVMLPVTKYLPGFGYFANPARYSVLTMFGLGLLCAQGWTMLGARLPHRYRAITLAVIFVGSTFDLQWAGSTVSFTKTLKGPLINWASRGKLRAVLAGFGQPVRVFGRGQGLLTCLGVAATPPFLALPPKEYSDSEYTLPQPWPFDAPASPAQIEWLQTAGVTHVLSFERLDSSWPVNLVWSGNDAFVNTAFGRQELLYLYELRGTRGRVTWLELDARIDGTAIVREYKANSVRLTANSNTGGRLVLSDLAYPGWNVSIDGQSAEAITVDKMYRGVTVPTGEHDVVWTYEPRSVYGGAIVSIVTLTVLICFSCVAYLWRRPTVR